MEDILKKHPAIKDASVIGKPDEKSGELPTAFVVKHANVEITKEEIINYVAGSYRVMQFELKGLFFL